MAILSVFSNKSNQKKILVTPENFIERDALPEAIKTNVSAAVEELLIVVDLDKNDLMKTLHEKIEQLTKDLNEKDLAIAESVMYLENLQDKYEGVNQRLQEVTQSLSAADATTLSIASEATAAPDTSEMTSEDSWLYKNLMEGIKGFSHEKAIATVAYMNLPQNSALSSIHTADSIVAWAARTNLVDPDRYTWHLKRACGFGGSDVGAITANYCSQQDPLSNARDIVSSKLLMKAPFSQDAAMEIGTAMEPNARAAFYKKLEDALESTDTICPHEKALAALNAPIGTILVKDHPWAGYSADDILLIKRMDASGVITETGMLPDYKVSQHAAKEDVLQRYKDQVMYGAWLVNELAKNDQNIIPIDTTEIFIATYAPHPVTNKFQINIQNIEYSEERVSTILAACDKAWAMRQRCELPEIIKNPVLTPEVFAEKQDQWLATNEKSAVVLAQISALNELKDSLKESIQAAVNKVDLGDKAVIATPSAQVSITRSLNTERAIQALIATPSVLMSDIEACVKLGSLNEDKVGTFIDKALTTSNFYLDEMVKDKTMPEIMNAMRDQGDVDAEKIKSLMIKSELNPDECSEYSGRGCVVSLIRGKNPRVKELKNVAVKATGLTTQSIYEEMNPLLIDQALLSEKAPSAEVVIIKDIDAPATSAVDASTQEQTVVSAPKKRAYTRRAVQTEKLPISNSATPS